MHKNYLQTLKDTLFADTHLHVYAIVDSAVDAIIDMHFESDEPNRWILYTEEQDREELEQRAPYLIELNQEDIFSQRVLEEGYGNHWGCFLLSEYHAEVLAAHLSNYTKIYSQAHDQDVYIRFYDPRAIGQYFPCFTKEESQNFYSKITSIMVEKVKEPNILYTYSFNEKHVHIQRTETNLSKKELA